MADPSSSNPLTDQALKRLRALAEGNGVVPSSIALMHGEEKIYDLEGVMTLTPLCDVQARHYVGSPLNKAAIPIMGIDALHQDVTRRQNEFRQNPNWLAEVKEELKTASGQGWGLDGASVTLASRAVILVASSRCPQCQGNKMVTCAQCQGQGATVCAQCRGQRQEICYNCNGSGQNPLQQGQVCPICSGTTRIVCRMCRGTGQTVCPVCGGKRGTPCPACKGSGQITEEAHLTFGATTHFNLKSSGLPSGLRRGLDRLGIVNLGKGHADIELVEPKAEPEDGPLDDPHAPPPKAQAAPAPTLHYVAHLPFAELRIDFAGKKAIVGAFGKRGALLDVPPFLDSPLESARTKLAAAAQGRASIGSAIDARAIRNALALELQGKGNAKEFRRLYPFGISGKVVDEIIGNIRRAIKQTTLRLRIAAAAVCTLLSGGIFAGCYFTSLPTLLAGGPRWAAHALDFAPLLLAEGLAWLALGAAMRHVLQKDFPDMKIALRQTPGKTGNIMMAVIAVIWLAVLMLSPARPFWLPLLIR